VLAVACGSAHLLKFEDQLETSRIVVPAVHDVAASLFVYGSHNVIDHVDDTPCGSHAEQSAIACGDELHVSFEGASKVGFLHPRMKARKRALG
jgi:hypothetical protein